jgi:hypothetical protein
MYYELSGKNKPLPPDTEEFKFLMQKSEELNKKFHNDMDTSKKSAKESIK